MLWGRGAGGRRKRKHKGAIEGPTVWRMGGAVLGIIAQRSTWSMPFMALTLDVSMSSGWLKEGARCQPTHTRNGKHTVRGE